MFVKGIKLYLINLINFHRGMTSTKYRVILELIWTDLRNHLVVITFHEPTVLNKRFNGVTVLTHKPISTSFFPV